MDHTYEKKNEGVVFVEPVCVEDRPLPFRVRAWELVRRAAFGMRRQLKRSAFLRKVAWAVIALMALAAAPALLIAMLLGSGRSSRRTAGAAF